MRFLPFSSRYSVLLVCCLCYCCFVSCTTGEFNDEKGNNLTSVCIFQPITSRINAHSDLHTTVLFNATYAVPMITFMNSLAPTLEPRNFTHHLYLGFDFGDPLWDSAKTRTEFETLFAHVPIHIHWIRLYGTGSQVTLAHNTITKTVYADGCEYIVFSNDDLVWYTKDWTSKAVAQLRNYLVPNLGMVAFSDAAVRKKIPFPAFHMVHRTHMDMIDEFSPVYCPITHRQAYCDPFMFDVYAPFGLAVLRTDIQVHNPEKTRYVADSGYDETQAYLRGRVLVAEELERRGKLEAWMPSGHQVLSKYPKYMFHHPWLHADKLVPSPVTIFKSPEQ